ncbi:MAG: glycosyltransferase family 4 protein [Hyphomicrobiaceae bacterium]|nr:glycosyltransferase family 4 protein [Hyphomicrobiaceae bacterium]
MVLRAPIGGLYRHVVDLSGMLAKRGHQVGIVMDSEVEDAQTFARIDALPEPPALGVHRVRIPRVLGLGDFTASFKIRDLANSLKVDVVHGHGAKGGFSARWARLGVPGRISAYTPHGGVLHYSATSLAGILFRRVEWFLLFMTDAMTFESAYARSEFEHQIGKVKCLSRVILNGLDESEFEPLDAADIDHDFAYVGELRPIKGIDVMLRALPGVKRPDGQPATLVLGGGGPEEMSLKALAQELGISQRVEFVGVQPARSVFGRGRVAIVPSRGESLPYVCLEAAAASKPLIATRVGGIAEIFGPTSASLVPPENVSALAGRMQAALDDMPAEQAEAERRFAHVREGFSMLAMTDGIEAAYYDAIAARKR